MMKLAFKIPKKAYLLVYLAFNILDIILQECVLIIVQNLTEGTIAFQIHTVLLQGLSQLRFLWT